MRAPERNVAKHPNADEAVLEHTLTEAADLAYTDPGAARKLLLPFRALVDDLPISSAPLEIGSRQLLGNLANQELDFALAQIELAAALDRAIVAGLSAKQAELIADLLGPLLNLDKVTEAADFLDAGKAIAREFAPDATWRLLTREGFLQLRIGDTGAAFSCFAEAQQLQQTDVGESMPVRTAYYASLLQAGLAKLYTAGQDFERGVAAYREVVSISEAYRLLSRLPYHYLELGRALMLVDNQREAERNFQLAVQCAGGQDRLAKAAALANLGYYASRDWRFNRATQLFDEAEHHYKAANTNAFPDLAMVYVWRAEMAAARGLSKVEGQMLAVALERSQEGDDLSRQAFVSEKLADYHARHDQYAVAYEYRLYFEELQRAVDIASNARRISELELRHELEQRRQEGELLRLRATQLQLKALRAQMNPHFIFNALNAIQEFITSHRATDAAAHLAKFARLMRQSLEYSERESISLEEEIAFLDQYLSLNQALRYQNSFTYEITVGEDLEDDLIRLPAMLVQPYLENALEHGIRQVPAGHISLEFDSPAHDEDLLLITIRDNGVGRAAAARRITLQKHKSLGTDITRHRLELLNDGNASTQVVFNDLYNEDGTAAGTEVRIALPIRWLA